MRPVCLAVLALSLPAFSQAPSEADKLILDLRHSPYAKLHNVPVPAVTIQDGFWSARRKTSEEKSIPTMLALLEEHGTMDNFRRMAGKSDAKRRGPLYTDSDIYKWIEAVGFVLQSGRNAKLEAQVDSLAQEIVAAQEPSGYLNTYWQDERKSQQFQQMRGGHELYCLGHLLEAAIAYYRATGKRVLLDAGIRFADFLIKDFGPGKRPLLAGHPNIEMALVELSRTTGDPKYIKLAAYILGGERERLKLTPDQMRYMFSGRPFTERTIMEGHAVRAGYACAGATDYYLETGDPAFKKTLETLWQDMTASKMYITGGIGSRAEGEAFGEAYELPNSRAYTESCAAIANLMWNWRMLHATGEARFTDVMERALYNSINSGMSLSGTMYCYRNPLELSTDGSKDIRNPWYDTVCCPPNLERTFAALPGYFYSTSADGLYVHLYDNNALDWKLEDGTPIKLTQHTAYPWEGAIDVTVTPASIKEFTLFLRIPDWSQNTTVQINGKRATETPKPGAYLALKRQWSPGDTVRLVLDMHPQVIAGNPLLKENYGRVAIQRGPIVYCVEQEDQPDTNIDELTLKLTNAFTPETRKDLLGGVVVLKHHGAARKTDFKTLPLYQTFAESKATEAKGTQPADITLIPYYTFANRDATAMQVWLPYLR